MAHSEEWAIGYVGGWKKAETGEEAVSQWSTLPIGPLARRESMKKAETVEKVASQWSTLESGPLARLESMEKGRNRGKSREPVVHFGDWTTSSTGNRRKS